MRLPDDQRITEQMRAQTIRQLAQIDTRMSSLRRERKEYAYTANVSLVAPQETKDRALIAMHDTDGAIAALEAERRNVARRI